MNNMGFFNPFGEGGSGGGGGSITIDTQVNGTSTNAVQNKAIYNFVNSSVATNTANFIDTFNSVEELEVYTGTVTNNDYAFVIGTDLEGNTVYNRYKYNGSEWVFEYTLNNSSFTAAQWATIQSGLTASDKEKLDGIEAGANKTVVDANLSQTSTNPVQNKVVNSALATKQDTIADLAEIRSGAAAGSTAVQQTAFETDQQRQETEIGVVANAGAKNVFKNTAPYGELVRTNITFTHNSDDTYLVNAENPNTAITDLYVAANITLEPGDYILTGCPAGGDNNSTYKLQLAGIGYDTGNGFRFTITQTRTVSIYIRIWAGYVPNGLVFSPMLRPASITDSTFVPYAPTNRKLYETKTEQTETNVIANFGAKNLLKITASSQTIKGVTFTVNDDQTVTVNGTNDGTGASTFVIVPNAQAITIPDGNYILSGCPTDGGSDVASAPFDLRWYMYSPGKSAYDSGNGASIEKSGNGTGSNIAIVVKTGQTANNLVFKPMVRPAEITDDTFVPYAKTNRELTVAEDEDRAALVALVDEVSQLKNYIGYEKSQILGLQADYQNKIFTRLGKAVDLNPGSDFNQFNIYNKRRRCNVSDDGTINAFYGESSYIEDGTNGQVMVYQPKFYYKVEPLKLEPIVDGEGYHIRKANYYISETPRDGFKLHPAFKDENGNELEYYLISAYEASLYDVSESKYILDDAQVADFSTDKICSIANAKPISGLTQNLTRSNCEKLATNRGTRWHNMTIQIASAEQLLFMIEYGKMNAQEAIGKGVVNRASGEGNESINTGSTSNLGNTSGVAFGTDGLVSIAYRGVENLWGNIWNWIDGVNIWGDGTKKGGIPYITNKLPFVENTKIDYNSAGFTTASTNGYISAMGYGNPDYDWVFFASETTGNSTLPVGDYQYYTANLNDYRVAVLGGYWTNGLNAGLFYWGLYYSSSARSRYIGGRGVIIPDINATNYWTNIRKAS